MLKEAAKIVDRAQKANFLALAFYGVVIVILLGLGIYFGYLCYKITVWLAVVEIFIVPCLYLAFKSLVTALKNNVNIIDKGAKIFSVAQNQQELWAELEK